MIGLLALANGLTLRITRQQALRFLGYGVITAAHFWFYINSLTKTSITHSLTLVNTSPLFLTVLSVVWLKEAIPARKYLGIVMAIGGIAVLTGFGEINLQGLEGDLMALVSAVCYALYSLAGRRERNHFHVLTYAFWVYTSAAVCLAPVAVTQSHWPYPPMTWVALGLLALLPTACGHTLYNAAVRHTKAVYANLISTQEVTGGIFLGWLMWHEPLSSQSLWGAAITVLGIALVYIL